MIRRLFIRLMATIQKSIVTRIIHVRWSTASPVRAGRVIIRIRATRCVRGSRASAIYWRSLGQQGEREERAGEECHRCDEQERGIVQGIDAGRDRSKTHRQYRQT